MVESLACQKYPRRSGTCFVILHLFNTASFASNRSLSVRISNSAKFFAIVLAVSSLVRHNSSKEVIQAVRCRRAIVHQNWPRFNSWSRLSALRLETTLVSLSRKQFHLSILQRQSY